jgi:hypothetical protein
MHKNTAFEERYETNKYFIYRRILEEEYYRAA